MIEREKARECSKKSVYVRHFVERKIREIETDKRTIENEREMKCFKKTDKSTEMN